MRMRMRIVSRTNTRGRFTCAANIINAYIIIRTRVRVRMRLKLCAMRCTSDVYVILLEFCYIWLAIYATRTPSDVHLN